MALIFKNKNTLYFLKDSKVKPSSIDKIASETGCQVKELNDISELIHIVRQYSDETLLHDTDKTHLLKKNIIEEKGEREILRLYSQIQWLFPTLDIFQIGLMISNGEKPFIINPVIQNIIQVNPLQIEDHPIRNTLFQEQRHEFENALNKLAERKIKNVTRELKIKPPASNVKTLNFYGKVLELNGLSLVAEYIIEKKPSLDEGLMSLRGEKSLIGELHKTISGLCGVLKLLPDYEREAIRSEEEKHKENRDQYNLTKRESQILRLIYEGYTSQKIADLLYISKRTVESHRANILHKTNTRNTPELIRFAIHHKLL